MKRTIKFVVFCVLVVAFTIIILMPSPVQLKAAGDPSFPWELPGSFEPHFPYRDRWVCHCPDWVNTCSCCWIAPYEP